MVVRSSIAEAELKHQTGGLGDQPSRGVEAGALGFEASNEAVETAHCSSQARHFIRLPLVPVTIDFTIRRGKL